MNIKLDKIMAISGDSRVIIPEIPDNSIDLVLTSPPYADARDFAYQSCSPKEFPFWLLQFVRLTIPKLKTSGSILINLGNITEKGQRSLYPYETVRIIKENTELLFIDEIIWAKIAPLPSKSTYRFKNGYERIFHFAKSFELKFYPERQSKPIKPSNIERTMRQRKVKNTTSQTGSKISGNTWKYRERFLNKDQTALRVLPANIVSMHGVAHNQGHPAAMSVKLAEYFISLFTDIGDTVLDPFCGTGAVLIASKNLGRIGLGIDIEKKYIEYANNWINKLGNQSLLGLKIE